MTLVDRVLAVRDRVAVLTPRAQSFALYLPVLVIASLVRLVNLGSPKALVFDEIYYVRDAWTMWNLGYEAQWEATANFSTGHTSEFLDTAAFVAHPPLGKWLIGAGMALFGPNNSFGWRFAVALAGIAVVALTIAIASRLFRSKLAGALAGLIVALDGVAITMSRTALLDGFLAMFILAAFLVVLRHLDKPGRGQWLFLAGALLGAACAVKWSGLYALAVFTLWVIVARRSIAPLLMTPIAVAVYIASWSGWLLSTKGYDRNLEPFDPSNPVLSSLSSLWQYHQAIYDYNITLTTPHGYMANPTGWLLMIRPTAFYYETACGDGCAEYITSVANPVFWYLGVIALGVLISVMIRTRSHLAVGIPILVGVAATYIPWLAFSHRTVFQFYTVSLQPFLALAAVWWLLYLWRRGWETFVVGIVGIGIVIAAFFLPVWMGLPIPVWFAAAHYWFPTWI